MGRRAKIFAYSVITAGSAVFLLSLSRWNQADRAEFWTLLVLSAVASQVKVRFPGFAGTFTASLFVSFICLLELSLGEAAVIALASSAVQTFWKARTRPSSLKLLFNFAALSITVCGSADVYRLLQEHAAWLGAPGQLGSLAAVYFFLNTAPVALIVALTGGGVRNSLRGWRDTYASMWPFYFAGAALAGLLHYSAGVWGWQVTVLALPLLYLVERSYSIFFGRLEDSKRHLDEMAALQMRSIRTLALAVEAKDDTTHTHLHRVQTYAMEIGRELGLSAEELLALQAASILHDVGKLAVPEHIISKPGKLNAEEFEKMKIHTVVGAEIVEGMEFPYPVAPIVRAHHEKWNGMGYPYGLKETAIPIGARILSAVDCLDALATDRQYRRALPLDKAMDIVIADSGKAFDPKVVEVLSRRYRELEALAHSTLASVKVQAFSVNDRVALGASPDAGLEVSTRITDRASVLAGISRVRSEVHRIVGRLPDIPAASRWDYLSMALSMELRDVIPHHGVAVYQKRADKIVALGASGEDGDLLRKLSVPEGQGFVGWVAENRKPILNGNPSVEPVSWERPVTLRAGLAVPMLDGDSVRGVLALYHRSADSFCRDHLHILEMLGPLFVSALELSELQVPAVNEIAVNDLAAILAVLDNKATSARKLSLARLDICGLALNSTEDALRGILSGVFRGQDLVGQFSATEFLLLSDELDGSEMAQSINLVRRAFEERYGREGTLLVGIATLQPGHNSVEELLARAEQSLQDDRRRYQVEGLLGLSRVLGSSVSVQSESTLSPGLWKV